MMPIAIIKAYLSYENICFIKSQLFAEISF